MAKQHASDIWAKGQIATAVGFVIHFMKSPGERFREEAPSLAEAEAIAGRLNAQHGKNGRRAIIYAVMPNGSSLPVGEQYRTKPPAR